MTIIGLSIAELAALLGMLSIILGAGARFYTMFRIHITAPLIEALDSLRLEISQFECYLMTENQQLKDRTQQIDRRLKIQEKNERVRKEAGAHDHYRVVDEGQ